MGVEVRGLSKSFGAVATLRDLSVEIATGELVALLGPSGCGKTTLLRIIAGLEKADSGTILFDGKPTLDQSAQERRVGFVFQHYALFRHLSVFENIAFGLRVRPRRFRLPEEEICRKVRELVELVQMEHLAWHFPSQLSGGQRQRVALARALAIEPSLLLLDEPFGALDMRVRRELRRWLRRLHDDLHVTSIFVTHDQEEALEVADRVVVMNEGRVEQVGTPEEVHDQPKTEFVYSFLGQASAFRPRFGAEGATAQAQGNGEDGAQAVASEGRVAFVRPHDVLLSREPAIQGPALQARIARIQIVGPQARVELETLEAREPIDALLTRDQLAGLQLRAGEIVYLRFRNLRYFEAGAKRAGQDRI